jgi:predicted ATP-dependent serine protease
MTCHECAREYYYFSGAACDRCVAYHAADEARAQAEIARNAARAEQEREWARLLTAGANRGWAP